MKTLRWLALLAFGLLLPRIAGLAPRAVERYYGRDFFPGIAALLGRMSGTTRVSIAEWVAFAAAVALLWILVAGSVRAVRRRSLQVGFGPLHRWVAGAAILVFAFHIVWGLNYARPLLHDRLRLAPASPNPESLTRLTRLLAEETNRQYRWAVQNGQIEPGEDGSRLLLDRWVVADRLSAAYAELQPLFARVDLSSPKFPSPAGWILTRLGISGFYFPFTGEANVNGRMPDPAFPFTMAHEMAHQRGTAPEDQANFWAYLACSRSGLAAARYGGALSAFGLAYGALWQADPTAAHEISAGLLEEGPRADRTAIREFWTRHETKATEVSTRVNDAYLKMNAQRGVVSYGLAVDLLVALMETGGIDGRE